LLDIEGIVEEAGRVNASSFLQLIGEVRDLMAEEVSGGVGPGVDVVGRLVKLRPEGDAFVVGDIHGDLGSLVHILADSGFMGRASKDGGPYLIFLGDYGDRGVNSPEVYYVILTLKLNFPSRVILLRGNHEGPKDLLAYPHDLPYQLRRRFGGDGDAVYDGLNGLFDYLYTALIVEGRFVMLHGGVPSRAVSVEDLAYAHERHPAQSHLEEVLWSDPVEGLRGTYFSPRGAGMLFGEDVTVRFLRMLGVNVLFRGHEPCDLGYKFNHHGRVLTLFSRKGAPYYNERGAYLAVDLSRPVDNVRELEPNIHTF